MAEATQANKVSLREALRLNGRALGLLWKERPQLILSMALSSAAGSLAPYIGIFFSARILNELSGARDAQTLARLVFWALIVAALWALTQGAARRWCACERASLHFLCGKIHNFPMLRMDFARVDDSHTHDLRSQIAQNQNWGGWGLYQVYFSLEASLKALAQVAGAVALSVSLFTLPVPESAGALTALNHPAFILLLIAAMLGTTALAPLLSYRADQYWLHSAENVKEGNRFFGFAFSLVGLSKNWLDVRTYRQERYIAPIINVLIDKLCTPGSWIARRGRGAMGLLMAASASISHLFTALVYGFVCLKAYGGAFGIGSVTQYIGAITSLSGGLSALLRALGIARNNAAFLRATFEYLDLPSEMRQGTLTVEKRNDRKYEIELRDVSFRYPGSEVWALRHVNLSFRIGERLAVVGENGSGKTTFIKLLCRLYDPTEGEIRLNGIDIRKYRYDEYLSLFSVVFQDFQLLAFPLGQNVAASAHFDAARATACLEEAGFGERLRAWKQGLNTALHRDFDPEGVEVSGGEAQKIALARALYKDAPFIVLDEPTAALDPVAEAEVYTNFNKIVGDKTAVFISHRLSSCRFCDEIAVFDQGQVVQKGAHDALVRQEGSKYRELWQAQAQYYANDASQD